MAIADIENLYKKMYESQRQGLKQKTDSELMGLQNQEGQVNNEYQSLFNELGNRRNQAAGEYQTQQNQAAVTNSRNVAGIRDWMAKNNLLQSGENVDAILRANTDYGNERGRIKGAENQYYTQLDTQKANAEREKALKISDIMNRRNLINSSFQEQDQALSAGIEAQKIRDILAYQEQERQRQWQEEQARKQYERQLAASRAKASSTPKKMSTADKDVMKQQYFDQFNNAIYDGDYERAKAMVYNDQDNLIKELGRSYWQSLEKKLWDWQAGPQGY